MIHSEESRKKMGHPNNKNNLGRDLSVGQKQRVGFSRLFKKNPSLIILDEATNGLDDLTEKKLLKNLIKTFSRSIIVVISHKKNISNYCDVVYELKNKKLYLKNNR
jgi:ABC-type bacteriocin/lantibiotic exporter with double-glycine peptidase domain